MAAAAAVKRELELAGNAGASPPHERLKGVKKVVVYHDVVGWPRRVQDLLRVVLEEHSTSTVAGAGGGLHANDDTSFSEGSRAGGAIQGLIFGEEKEDLITTIVGAGGGVHPNNSLNGGGAGATIQQRLVDGGNKGIHSAAQAGPLLVGDQDHVRLDIARLLEMELETRVSNMGNNGAGGGNTDDAGVASRDNKVSVVESDEDCQDKYTKVLLILLSVSASASWSAYPVIEKAVGPELAPVAYSLLCVLIIILAVGSFVTVKFEKAPWSKVFGKYALLLSLVILVALPTWVLVSMILAAASA